MHGFKLAWQNILITALFSCFSVYWLVTQTLSQYDSHHQIHSFSTVYGSIALIGGIYGLVISYKWGGYKTTFGRAIMMFALGLLFQEFGQLSYSYNYIILHLSTVDYPSFGDLGFFGSIPLYAAGVIFLAKVSGANLRLKSMRHILPAVLITFIILSFGYVLFLQGYIFDWSSPIKVFLDFGYPLGGAIYISLAISTYLLSRGVLGGIMKNKILFILLALLVQFIADYTFLYQVSKNTWVDGGINDFIYLISYFVMSLAIIEMQTTYKKLKAESR